MAQVVVNEVAEAITALLKSRRGSLDPDKLLRAVLLRTGAEFGEIFLLDQERHKLVLRTFKGFDDAPLQDKAEFDLGKGLPGLVAQSGEPIIRTYLGGEPRFMKRAQQKGIRFFACLPIKVGYIVIGTIHIASMQPTLFKPQVMGKEAR